MGNGRSLAGVMHTSGKDDWATPQHFFDFYNKQFNFKLDVCASDWNAKCARYYTAAEDGLARPWATWSWCNPPYSQILKWYAKAYNEALRGNSSVVLTFARTDTRAFHQYAVKASQIIFLKGRLKFLDPATQAPSDPAPAPSILVVFDAQNLNECKFSTGETKV